MLQIVKYVAMSQVLVDEEPRMPNRLGTEEGVQAGVIKVSPSDDILHKSLQRASQKCPGHRQGTRTSIFS